MALSKEQFQALRAKGLSVEQIAAFDQGKKPAMVGGKFTVPSNETSEQKIKRYQAEQVQYDQQAKEANSVGGFIKNFGKALVSNLAPSEVGLGNSIAKIINVNSDTTKGLQQTKSMSEDIKANLLKKIREEEAAGRDATRLKQAYNNHVGSQDIKNVDQKLAEATTLPSTSQVTGQIAGTALDLLTAGNYSKGARALPTGKLSSVATSPVATAATATGLSELGTLANQKSSGLFTAKGLANVGTGTATGYAYDVASGLQGNRGEDRTGAKAFIPGAGTALGGSIPLASEATKTFQNVRSGQGTTNKRLSTLADLESKYKKVRDVFQAGDAKGIDVRKVLAETDLLNGAVDADGLITKEKAISNFNEAVAPYEGRVREALQKEGRKVSTQDIAVAADEFIQNSRLLGEANSKLENAILADIKNLTKSSNQVPLTIFQDLKVQRGSTNNYLDGDANAVNKEVTRFYKELIEKYTTGIDVQKYNAELSKLYTVRDALEALDRTRVKNGRLGKYFSQTVGAVAGSSFGPLGSVIGAEVGNQAQGAALKGSLGGDINRSLEPSPAILDALKPTKTGKDAVPTLTLPKNTQAIPDVNLQSSNQTGSRMNSQTIAMTNANRANILSTVPKSGAPSTALSTGVSESVSLPKNTTNKKMQDFLDGKTNSQSGMLNLFGAKRGGTKAEAQATLKKLNDQYNKLVQQSPKGADAIQNQESKMKALQGAIKYWSGIAYGD